MHQYFSSLGQMGIDSVTSNGLQFNRGQNPIEISLGDAVGKPKVFCSWQGLQKAIVFVMYEIKAICFGSQSLT